MNDLELGWLAGIIDGEGCFSGMCNGKGKHYPRISVTSTDLDILQEILRITNVGHINGPRQYYRKDGKPYKPQWAWITHGYQAAQIMSAVYPLLCLRRRGKIDEILLNLVDCALLEPPISKEIVE